MTTRPVIERLVSSYSATSFKFQHCEKWQMLKGPGLISSDQHLLLVKCNCRTYDDNIGPKLKKPSFEILGALYIDRVQLKHPHENFK